MTSFRKYDDILALVDRPSRYLGQEINSRVKDPAKVDLHMALAFPDLYEIGTSHFGIHILYHILNNDPQIYAERVFAPAEDMSALLKARHVSLFSLETRTPLKNFDIVGFSLLYELNYTNVLLMLELSGIPFYSNQRDESLPLIIAGGPCTCNPEPMAEFFDAMVVGDGEEVLIEMCRVYIGWKKGGNRKKTDLLKGWSEIQGVYVPAFFKAEIDEPGFQVLSTEIPGYTKIKRAVVGDLDKALFPVTPVMSASNPVHDRLRLEIARGCSRGCRFCQAGMIYRPVRERSFDTLVSIAEEALAATGYEELSLLSLSTGDYGCIVPLMEYLLDKKRKHPLAVSLPSIRAETLTPKVMSLIRQVRKTGFTIAPEAGTQRLRDVINKNICEKDIMDAVQGALEMGWLGIKLYFMVGLPTETDEDVDGIVTLAKKLRDIKTKSRRPHQITVSVAAFIPKPHTPFQWASQISLDEARDKIFRLKKELTFSRVQFKWQNPEVSVLEGLWARGDRRLSRLLAAAYEKGCRFDGWSDQFKFDLWQEALDETRINIDEFTTRTRIMGEPLPWGHIDIGVKDGFLKKEWEKAINLQPTPDCRWGDCCGCGVCDFKGIDPRVFAADKAPRTDKIQTEENLIPPDFKKLKLTYSKTGVARFLGHLELINVFIRAIRRGNIEVKYSEGYHPKAKLSFNDPTPLGVESLNEYLILTVPGSVRPKDVEEVLNEKLPPGLHIKGCEPAPSGSSKKDESPLKYSVTLSSGSFDEQALEKFFQADRVLISRSNKKGDTIMADLKKAVYEMNLRASNILELSLITLEGKTYRPHDLLDRVFGLTQEQIKTCRILKC